MVFKDPDMDFKFTFASQFDFLNIFVFLCPVVVVSNYVILVPLQTKICWLIQASAAS